MISFSTGVCDKLSSNQKNHPPWQQSYKLLNTRKTSQLSNPSAVYDCEKNINASHAGFSLLFKTFNLAKFVSKNK